MAKEIRYSNAWLDSEKIEFVNIQRDIRMLSEELRSTQTTHLVTVQYAQRVHALESARQTAETMERTADKVTPGVLRMMLTSLREAVSKAKGTPVEQVSRTPAKAESWGNVRKHPSPADDEEDREDEIENGEWTNW